MKFLPLSDHAVRQAIDSAHVWAEYLRARAEAQRLSGGMYWKKEGGYEYLVKTLEGNKQKRLGARSPETEQTYAAFHARKKAAMTRLASLTDALNEAQRLNKALRAGRTPDIVVKLLNALREAGLERHFRVVGAHALYAYESCAGVRIISGALATQGVDLFGDAKRKMEFLVDQQLDVGSVLAVLQRMDASFQRRGDTLENEGAINAKGFEVVFWRWAHEDGAAPSVQDSDKECSHWHAQSNCSATLTLSPMFSQPVISGTGKMATMNTVTPQTFVEFNRRLADLEARDEIERRRATVQACIVQEMLETRLLTAPQPFMIAMPQPTLAVESGSLRHP